MPNSAEHDTKFRFNRDFLDTGLVSANPEWAAVVAFYAAVHLVERLGAAERRRPIHHENHVLREDYLSRHRQHRVLYVDYMALKDSSITSRYGTVRQFQTQYPSGVVQAQLIDVHLAAIERYVTAFFAPPPPPPGTPNSGTSGS